MTTIGLQPLLTLQPQVHIEIVNGGLLGIYKPCRCCDARQDVDLQGLCGNRLPATCCKHDGGVHDNVDVREPVLVESVYSIGAAVVVASRSSLSRSVHDTLLRLMRFLVSNCPCCCSRHVLVERHVVKGELDFNKNCSNPKVVDQHANVWHWVTADWGVSAMAVVNATGWPSSQ